MAIVIPAGFAQTTCFFSSSAIDGGEAVVTHGWSLGTNSLDQLAQEWADAVSTGIDGYLHTGYSFTGVRAITALADDTYPGSGPGLRSGDASPPNICVLEKKGTALRGREHRGRAYWPGLLIDGDVDDSGGIDNGRYVLLVALFTAMYTAMSTAGFQPYILHNSGATAPTEVTTATPDPKVATQRRRLRR